MRKFVLAAVLVLMASGAQASSYLQIGGNVVDPILTNGGGVHSYSGPNLQPSADLDLIFGSYNLIDSDLYQADLYQADLTGTNLSGANLSGANLNSAVLNWVDLTNADLTGADLSNAFLFGTNLSGANLSGANLSNATYLGTASITPDYDAQTNFSGAWSDGYALGLGNFPFDPVAAGWNLVPEPSTALLLGLGLVGMAARRWV